MPRSLRVLLAADKFKGSLTAAQVAAHLERGMLTVGRDLGVDIHVTTVPVADGGDGTLAAAAAAGFRTVSVRASGPTGGTLDTSYGVRGLEAVVELAAVSGLALLPGGELHPLTATSRGTGEVVRAAIEAGCRTVVVGIGGSACTDGGAGLVSALGAQIRDTDGNLVEDGGAALAKAASLDLGGLRDTLAGVEVVVACDVDNPLTGPRGAAAIYGPQKGATPTQVVELDHALAHWADLVAAAVGTDHRDDPGAGAAGGVGFAAVAMLGARLESGVDLVLDLTGFTGRLAELGPGDLVVTGEGSLDEQTLRGKAPAGVAKACRAKGVRLVAVAGSVLVDDAGLAQVGCDAAYALTALSDDRHELFTRPGPLLERIGARIAREHLAMTPPAVTATAAALPASLQEARR